MPENLLDKYRPMLARDLIRIKRPKTVHYLGESNLEN